MLPTCHGMLCWPMTAWINSQTHYTFILILNLLLLFSKKKPKTLLFQTGFQRRRFSGSLADRHCALYKFTYLLTYLNMHRLTVGFVIWRHTFKICICIYSIQQTVICQWHLWTHCSQLPITIGGSGDNVNSERPWQTGYSGRRQHVHSWHWQLLIS